MSPEEHYQAAEECLGNARRGVSWWEPTKPSAQGAEKWLMAAQVHATLATYQGEPPYDHEAAEWRERVRERNAQSGLGANETGSHD